MIQQKISTSPLSQDEIAQSFQAGLAGKFTGQRVLVLIPDHTRTVPLPPLFRLLVELLQDVKRLDFMVALGTHLPLDEKSMMRLLGITVEERNSQYADIGMFNHTWDDPAELKTIGVITQDEVKQFAGERWHPSLGGDVPVQLNKAVFDYDHILILGPTYPHEVVGLSGGAKYLFPGISGPEMINTTHWLGALVGVVDTIGVKETPVRAMIHAAASKLTIPVTLAGLVVDHNELAGIFIGDLLTAWDAAAELSAQRHILRAEQPYRRVLSCSPPMYNELWTGAKAMYKLEPVVAMGGEVIIYAPHLDTVSQVHGKHIYEIGYHILPYFLDDWTRYQHIPLAVLAHSTHMRGSGVMKDGVEKPNVKLTLASQISASECEQLNLGYLDPNSIQLEEWQDREDEGILYVPKAGEILYRLKGAPG